MSYQELIANAKRDLHKARAQVTAEIHAYPTPISGCDAQFNHLLAERSRLTAALAELDQPVFIPTPRTPAPDAGVESR
ncbi:MAG: hypothetical protein AAFY65_03850 [Pseudomonadota bacterium]